MSLLTLLLVAGCGESWDTARFKDSASPADIDLDGDGVLAVADGGTDCWDDPATIPTGFDALNGAPQLTAADVYPGATDAWYDGIDADCAGDDDFDQDGDGHAILDATIEVRGDLPVDDCYDGDIQPYPEASSDCAPTEVLLDAAEIYPGATDEWYDGTDANCDGADDFDQDGDGYASCVECDDTNPALKPNGEPEGVWYDGVDDNCDGNDGDQDGDGYYIDGYTAMTGESVPAAYHPSDPDCWDNPASVPEAQVVVDGATQLSADEVHPDAEEVWYDGADGDCAGDDDFDADADGYRSDAHPDRDGALGEDCVDDDAAVHPGSPEFWYDGVDQDCDGYSDFDQDKDGYDDGGYGGDDCDDHEADVNPGRTEDCGTATVDDNCDGSLNEEDAIECVVYFLDADGDSYGTTDYKCYCDGTGDYTEDDDTDCDDGDAAIHPDAAETAADTIDQDCDGGDTCYVDADGDSFGSVATVTSADLDCTGSGESTTADDCDDTLATAYPGATEVVGDEIDQSCDGSEVCFSDPDGDGVGTSEEVDSLDTDCGDPGEAKVDGAVGSEIVANENDDDGDGFELCYVDADGDTFGTSATVASSDVFCKSAGSADNPDDCDDANYARNPGLTEVTADSLDNDCNGEELCYVDGDADGYGTSATVASTDLSCTTSAGEADDSEDCNDASSAINPAATEGVANSSDDNCDGTELCYQDNDKDTYGSSTTVESADLTCSTAAGEADDNDDCDDSVAVVYPGATETVANTRDDDCDGEELCYGDGDKDTYGSSTTIASADLNCTTAAGEADNSDDCNDTSSAISPAATELVANATDDNCDGIEVCYQDDDKDGYGSSTTVGSPDVTCSTAAGEADDDDDCDDANFYRNPGLTEVTADSLDNDCDGLEQCYVDADHDSYGSTSTTEASTNTSCADTGESSNATDCADSDSSRNPGMTETTANSKDDDCDGYEQCYVDSDNDGYGSTTTSEASTDTDCTDSGESQYNTDCADTDSTRSPGKTEATANGKDDDCDGYEQCYVDSDLDTYGGTTTAETSADTDCTDSGEASSSTDCADTDSTRNPGKTETTANSKDDDCDGYEQCYVDSDLDTYGTSTTSETSADTDCSDSGESQYSTDCNDAASSVNPGATEATANGKDDDCDGKEQCYVDSDLDGYAGSTTAETSTDTDCTDSGEGTSSTDCNDSSSSIKPGATEITDDGIDEDCDSLESCYVDSDGDSYGSTTTSEGSSVLSCITTGYSTYNTDCSDSNAAVYPGAPEICDDGYNDCADSGTWTASDENSLVAFRNASTGAWSDVTSSFSAGTGGTPTTVTATTAGDYYVCSKAGDADWYAGFVISSLTVNVYGIASTGNAPTLSFNGKSGRVLQVTSSNVSVYDLDLYGGTKSGGSGGVAYISQSSTTTVYTTTFDNCLIQNGSATYGGGIAVSGNAAVALIDTEVYGNSGDYGGGIFLNGGASVTCDGSLAGGAGISSNDGNISGGAVYFLDATKGSFEAIDCDFDANTQGGSVAEDINGVGYSTPYNVGTVTDANFVCSSTGCF